MLQALIELGMFTAKTFIILLFVLLIFLLFFALVAKSKEKIKGRLRVKNINQKYAENTEEILHEVLPKKAFKKFLKAEKNKQKNSEADAEKIRKIFVLNFMGDIKASAVCGLREEITAILNVATSNDEVVLRLDSAGGVVHGYGLAAAQLMRLRTHNIPLTVAIDKVAASGGYLMACVANRILAAPFSIIGSIGVIVQLPNFHQVLKDKHIKFEQIMAGEYKRTISLFGENTPEGREKLQQEIEDVHQLFKNLISQYRQHVNIQKVATGEHWLGEQALGLKLVDEIKTSDEYLLEKSKDAKIFEIEYEVKKSFLSKFSAGVNSLLRFSF